MRFLLLFYGQELAFELVFALLCDLDYLVEECVNLSEHSLPCPVNHGDLCLNLGLLALDFLTELHAQLIQHTELAVDLRVWYEVREDLARNGEYAYFSYS